MGFPSNHAKQQNHNPLARTGGRPLGEDGRFTTASRFCIMEKDRGFPGPEDEAGAYFLPSALLISRKVRFISSPQCRSWLGPAAKEMLQERAESERSGRGCVANNASH